VGLTRTAPEHGAEVESMSLAVFSCQRFTHGHYTAHADLAEQAPDLVVCLGDYVYNTGEADGVDLPDRDDPIQDAVSLADFRAKYAHYRSDVNLQAMHSRAPLVAIPDNHDGAVDEDDPMFPGAPKAFFEKMPVREDDEDGFRTHRRIRWGRLLDLWMLDLMRWKTPGDRGSGNTDVDTAMMDPDVTYLGDAQRAWLFDGLAEKAATWQVLGSAKQFSPLRIRATPDDEVLNAGTYVNLDQWDGYQAERERVLDQVESEGLTGVVAVSGDMHWFWAADVTRDFNDPDAPAVMVDLLCGGISSSNANERVPGGALQTATLMQAFGPANVNTTRFFDADRHGYGLLHLRHDGAEVEYRSPETILEPTAPTEVLARFRLDPSRPGLEVVEPAGWPEGLVDGTGVD
jgi:alkaline phosphatase D